MSPRKKVPTMSEELQFETSAREEEGDMDYENDVSFEDEDKNEQVEEKPKADSTSVNTKAASDPAKPSKTITASTATKKPISAKNPIKAPEPSLPPGVEKQKARLVRLVKPDNPNEVVGMAAFDIMSGVYAKKRCVMVKAANIYAFGWRLTKANLGLNLLYGEDCSITFRCDRSGKLTTKIIFFGPVTFKPVKPAGSTEEFSNWLKKREITPTMFMKWINNEVFFRPYFPLKADIYTGRVVDLIWNPNKVGVGAIVKLNHMHRLADPNSKEKPLVRKGDTAYGLLLREDFYVCQFSVHKADIQYLLRPDQSVLCQIRKIGLPDLETYRYLLEQRSDLNISYIIYLSWVGQERPVEADARPTLTTELKKYLNTKKLLYKQFLELREFGSDRPAEIPAPLPNLMNVPVQGPIMGGPALVPAHHVAQHAGEMGMYQDPMMAPHRPRQDEMESRRDLGPKKSRHDMGSEGARRDFGVKNSRLEVATDIIRCVLDLESSDDLRVRTLLKNQEEVDLALKITSILTRAVSYKIESSVSSRDRDESRSSSAYKRRSETRDLPEPKFSRRADPFDDDFRMRDRDRERVRYEADFEPVPLRKPAPAVQRPRTPSPPRNINLEERERERLRQLEYFREKEEKAEMEFRREMGGGYREPQKLRSMDINPMMKVSGQMPDTRDIDRPAREEDFYSRDSGAPRDDYRHPNENASRSYRETYPARRSRSPELQGSRYARDPEVSSYAMGNVSPTQHRMDDVDRRRDAYTNYEKHLAGSGGFDPRDRLSPTVIRMQEMRSQTAAKRGMDHRRHY